MLISRQRQIVRIRCRSVRHQAVKDGPERGQAGSPGAQVAYGDIDGEFGLEHIQAEGDVKVRPQRFLGGCERLSPVRHAGRLYRRCGDHHGLQQRALELHARGRHAGVDVQLCHRIAGIGLRIQFDERESQLGIGLARARAVFEHDRVQLIEIVELHTDR